MSLPPFIDQALREDLDAIDAEVARRKAAKPFEPYAAWALAARTEALRRLEQRQTRELCR